MTRVIITTVGTSLKVNADKPGKSPAELLRDDPVAACAEANTLSRLLQPGDHVDLLHSQTPDGEYCAREICAWVVDQGYSAGLVPIDGLTHQAKDFQRGLRSLVHSLSKRIREVQRTGGVPILNALGGFKAEIAYATLVGALFGIPNVYMHQGFDELLTIPPLPVSWDFTTIDEYAHLLEWLDEEPRTEAEARSRLQQIPETLRDTLLETDGDGFTYLSPLGNAYFEAYRARIESITGTLLLSRPAAKQYFGAEPAVKTAFDTVLRRLLQTEVRRNGSKTLERKNGDVCVFPRGHVAERLFWFEDEETVHVVEITGHGLDYDRRYERGVFRRDYEDDWTAWSPG